MIEMMLMMVGIFAIMYFLLIRPQQRRMREQQEAVNALGPGARVLMQSGIYGTITHVGDRQAIVELAPGTEVTILKAAIMRAATADEEEFEFDDEADDLGVEEVKDLTEDADVAPVIPDEADEKN
ncbi:preprotein translocase subunit YajC [Arachnia propionica]|uniref:Preprotein translocase subunit YajC n=1 Tax=Arachnia propionica TaxID=1750 RepID=A0A3P1WUB2_9ACTN|nr:preprotein translocase subunit YajC [Arachnia propionica]RRD49825.1 preprotein translocase subunit YajC [Arachnia propionica]